jgi:hypothetical protein
LETEPLARPHRASIIRSLRAFAVETYPGWAASAASPSTMLQFMP